MSCPFPLPSPPLVTTSLFSISVTLLLLLLLLKINNLFLAALGLRCCAWAFSSCSDQELLFIAVHRLLIAVGSLVVEHGL